MLGLRLGESHSWPNNLGICTTINGNTLIIMIQSRIFGWESRDVRVPMAMKHKTLTELNLHDNSSNLFLLIQRKYEKITCMASK